MQYQFLFYVFLSFVIVSGGTYVLFMTNYTIAALIYLVGMIALVSYFGTRWFSEKGDALKAAAGPWPPSINTCPDFLALTYTTDTNKAVCVDTIGVATNMQKTTGTVASGDNNKIFNIYTASADAATRSKQLCNEAKNKGITWEGVWDGMNCLGPLPPLPPSKTT
jgi:hypothetical protein